MSLAFDLCSYAKFILNRFVSALSIPSWDSSLLISGGGDPELKVWDWMEGKLLHEIPMADIVMPFVKVTRKKARGGEGSDGEGGEETSKLSSKAKRKNRKKGRGKEQADSEAGGEDATENADAMQVDQVNTSEAKSEAPAEERDIGTDDKEQPPTTPLLAIQKVSTLESGSNRFIVFSAHGFVFLSGCYLNIRLTSFVGQRHYSTANSRIFLAHCHQ